MAADPTSGDLSRISLDGFHYQIVDSTVPSWARGSTKPTYNGGEVKYTGTTGNVVTNNTTLNVAVQALDTAVNNRLKYVLLSQAEYDSLATKDSGTLYLIGGTKYTITLNNPYGYSMSNIVVDGVSYTMNDFPIEVSEGGSISFNTTGSVRAGIEMGGETMAFVNTNTYEINNVTGDVEIFLSNPAAD